VHRTVHFGLQREAFVPVYATNQPTNLLVSVRPSIVDVNVNDNVSPLCIACAKGHLEVATFLSSQYPHLMRTKTSQGLLPIDIARHLKHTDMVEYLESIV